MIDTLEWIEMIDTLEGTDNKMCQSSSVPSNVSIIICPF
jgi:hypothetical protein